ncbi:carbohydrate ABC transporter permease [Kineococcus sp. SYSU DK003]|uniref:carbohydrate ABC transporter permease n=1 Tax=Kineococcus sp. SYSU DK003 TaxID=3383124 RepID=UPI003D7E9458
MSTSARADRLSVPTGPGFAENQRARAAKVRRERLTTLAVTVVVAAVVLGMLMPFAWAGLTAVKPFWAAFTNPPTWSFTPQFDAFGDLWRGTRFAEILLNTLLVAVAAVLVMLVVGAPAAYAFARYAGIIGPVLLVLAVVLRTVPRFAVVLPLYEAARAVGLYDTNIALVAAFVAVNMPFTLLLLVGFFRDIPEELDEAAMVDGCSRLGAFRRVIVPVMGPGLVTAGVFTFLVAFQEYLIALTLTQNDAVTIPVFIAAQRGADETSTYQLLAAASIALVLPIAFIAVAARRYLVAGLGGGAVKA